MIDSFLTATGKLLGAGVIAAVALATAYTVETRSRLDALENNVRDIKQVVTEINNYLRPWDQRP